MRYRTLSAVFVMIIKDHKILLQKRKNTGYSDGKYDLAASGHVEQKESLKEAVIRESFEEIGIEVDKENIEFVTLIHKNDAVYNTVYYNVYFITHTFQGIPFVKEPNKCSELKWFDLENLPANLIHDRKIAINQFLNEEYYDEVGWE